MNRRSFLTGMSSIMLTGSPCAQVGSRIARVGVLTMRPADLDDKTTRALIEGLRDRGYVEGANLMLEWPDAKGDATRLPAMAAELVRKKPDVILVLGPTPLTAAYQATKSIPIVMVASSVDPVRDGVAAAIARPGGNVTGLTYAEPDRFKKQLEVLKSIAPRISRVSVLWDFDIDRYRHDWQEPLTQAAQVLGLTVKEPVRVASREQLPRAIERMKSHADAFIVTSGAFMLAARHELAELALSARLPAVAAFKEFVEAGLLASWGPNLPDINRRAGSYVERILKGARPGDLPIELPNSFDLAINMRTAGALGLAVDPSLQLRATQVYR